MLDLKKLIAKMLDRMEANYIYANMTANQTLSTANAHAIVNINNVSSSAGSKLSLNTSTHKITIGAGVNYVRVSGSIYVTTLGTAGAKNVFLYKGTSIIARSIKNLTTNYNTIEVGPVVVPVSEGDTIYLDALSANGTTTVISSEGYSTKLIVEVVG